MLEVEDADATVEGQELEVKTLGGGPLSVVICG